MAVSPIPLLDITRPDVGIVVVSQWSVRPPEHQRAAAEAAIVQWESEPWPQALVSLNCFLSIDGESVLTYAQWTSDEAYREFQRSYRPMPCRRIDESIRGIERSESVMYRLYRSYVSDGSPRVPGCVVVVNIEADGTEKARQWVDFMIDDVGAKAGPPPGLISANFHISIDGTGVLNYAEWTDEEAHRAVESPSPTVVVRITEGVPGVRPVGFKRYRPYRSLAKPL